ncbi:GntR family transcriptional regulator [Spirilliplanes yamanashiensis]|uniref:GntR family transcriptional regulator n=1 Tax=Spirilliplanes yamanashiensis TaxID=42233 RepID=A0A8J3YBD0_9ACTN|nr:GntR family transcriptional regulator [Spirilliplanes yamanashiensis]MDP9817803.1 GntR family transcriptional regulator [Spirilliplanes yamanashiensis]GIJ04613.1 GntR family transcriptional regulator [Spirilliplanes yamanashiensis]
MTVNPGAAEFPHRQIAGLLREKIRRGDWQPGERLPSIPAMAEMFGVAKQTVQRTVDQLRVEGVLITKPGSGTYVRGTRRRLNRLSRGRYGVHRGYHSDLAARYRQHLDEVGLAPAPAEVADAFGVKDGTSLLVRRYVVRTDDAPVEVGASWFRPEGAAGTSLARAEAFGRPLYQEAEEVLGRRYAHATDTISARQPSREEAVLLQIRPDTPVLHLLHVAFDDNRKPIEVAQATWPGPVTTLTEEYRIPAPAPEPDSSPGLAVS